MLLLAAYSDRLSRISQVLTILVLLVVILVLTGLVTKWIASFEKGRLKGTNIELLEAQSLMNGKYVQILRIGRRYLAVAVCKDSVTVLCELDANELTFPDNADGKGNSFSALFGKVLERSGKMKEQEPVPASDGHGKVHAGNLEAEKKEE